MKDENRFNSVYIAKFRYPARVNGFSQSVIVGRVSFARKFRDVVIDRAIPAGEEDSPLIALR